MGGCQSASSDQIVVPKKSRNQEKKFKEVKKHKFALPENTQEKLQFISFTGKITNFITKTKTPVQLKYQQLDVGKFLAKDNKFMDQEFKPSKESIGKKLIKQEVEWKRPSVFMKENFTVFEGKIQPLDIKQGKLGDCYLLSATAAISQYPFIIKRIFQATQKTAYGAYGIWFFIDGLWQCVIVDDHFPLQRKKPIFSKNNGNEIWVMLLEKAYAKVFGSYEAIESGLTGIAMNTLTGAPYQYISRDSKTKITLKSGWDFITKNMQKGYMLTGSTENSDRNKHMGIISKHSYSIIDHRQVQTLTKTGKKKEKIIKLSNPWGKYQWKGRWSESSNVWTENLKKELDFKKADDGIFWMSLEDFIQNFGQICVCKYNKNYVSTSLQLSFDDYQNDFKGIFLKVGNKVEGYLSLIQKDHRHYLNSTYEYSMVRMIVIQIDKSTKNLYKYINDTLDCDHDATIQLELDPGDYYIFIQVDWKCNFTRDIVLNFYGQQSVSFVQDSSSLQVNSLFNEIVLLHEQQIQQERIYEYQKDSNITRVTGSIAGYIYYHYSNKSKHNNYVCEAVSLNENTNIQVDGEERKDEFVVKVNPDEDRIVRLKVKKEGNGAYQFSTKIQFYIIQKYSLEKLRDLADKRSSKMKQREIDGKQIDVIVKTYNYSGGVVLLYQNKMEKYAYVEEITFELQNLELENDRLGKSKKFQLELEPQSEKLLSFIVSRPGKQVVFRTKISFYLNSPEFRF